MLLSTTASVRALLQPRRQNIPEKHTDCGGQHDCSETKGFQKIAAVYVIKLPQW